MAKVTTNGKLAVGYSKKYNTNPKKTSIGLSDNSRPKSKNAKRQKGKTLYRGQGK